MIHNKINIAVVGATGYVGLELINILQKHPYSNIKYLCARKSTGKSIKNFDKRLNSKKLPKISKINSILWNNIDLLFTSLPNGQAQIIAKKLPTNVKLIDLSADFRLSSPLDYKKWYKKKHNAVKLIKESIYSLPEFSKNKIKKYKIISCPGCYPTSVQLPLIPLIQKKLINTQKIIVDSKSGLSGAGKNIDKKFKFKDLRNSVSVYGVGLHRHMPEIDQELSRFSNKKVRVHFTPHLIPMFRGILSTIYLDLKEGVNAKKIYNFLKKEHKKNFFVRIDKFNKHISTGEVLNTNYCNISICKDRAVNKIIIISTIDNLLKGAAGQAVQNMNLLYNIDEKMGLC